MARKQRNVFLAFAQRRHYKRDHVQSVKKIFAEVSLGNFFLQILVGGSNHAHIHGDWVVASDRNEALLLQRAQDFRLRLQAHVADFIQKQGSSIGFLKLAFLVGGSSRK